MPRDPVQLHREDPSYKIAAYRIAREHTRAVRDFVAAADTKGHSNLVRQLRDSTASVPANILEGKGEWRRAKQAHYLMIAKGSLMESWAHADTLVDFGLIDEMASEYALVRDKQHQIVALLITMIRGLEAEIATEHAEAANAKPAAAAAAPEIAHRVGNTPGPGVI